MNMDKKESRKSKNQGNTGEDILQRLSGALDEDISEMEGLSAADLEEKPPRKKRSAMAVKRRTLAVVGVVVFVFAIIGFVATVFAGVRLVARITDNTQQKEEIAQFIYPVVMNDPAPFDDVQSIQPSVLIMSAIWDIIINENLDKYQKDEFQYITIPQVDIESHATRLFGTGLRFQHQTVGDAEYSAIYDEQTQSYTVQVVPRTMTYRPFVEKIRLVGEEYYVTVGYVQPAPAWGVEKFQAENMQPDKYMEYVLSKANGDYTIVAINQPEELASSTSSQG